MSTAPKVIDVLTDMEDDIYLVEQFARVLGHVATGRGMVETECLYALSGPMGEVGTRLRERFRQAFTAAGGQA